MLLQTEVYLATECRIREYLHMISVMEVASGRDGRFVWPDARVKLSEY